MSNIRRSFLFSLLIILLYVLPLPAQFRSEKVRFLALGDSYTIGESVAESERWPVQLADALKSRGMEVDTVNIIARTGWRTDDLQGAIEARNPAGDYNLVSLLIGVNDQYQGYDTSWYRPRFRELLHTAIELAGGDKSAVFVVSIPDYAYTPFGQSLFPDRISSEIDDYNRINRIISGSMGINYYDITPISREGLNKPEYVAGDGLHPSGEMYEEWVRLIINGILPKTNAEDPVISTDLTTQGINTNPAWYDPLTDSLVFRDPVSPDAYLTILDSAGKPVFSGLVPRSDLIRINTADMVPGIYFYRLLEQSGRTQEGRFLKI